MNVQLFAGHLELGNIDAKVIDASMGVVGGELQATSMYFEQFQSFLRLHTQHPDWEKLQTLQLKAVLYPVGEIKAVGGICITDIEGSAKIEIEICGLDNQLISDFFLCNG